MKIETIDCDFDFNKSNYIAFLNGQSGLHETEANLFKALAARNYNNLLCIDDLFARPYRLQILSLMSVDTIIFGSTGTYADAFKVLMSAFNDLNYLPKNALLTMGEEMFWEYKDRVNIYSLMPMSFSDSEIVIWAK
jgi:hypothetical protein